ncbi:MAG: lipopolysaccharide cholinephosphotransferase [Legionellaceae bacterium]|nr:lipopolysaccharide cholinephosphotransferase [Legionellaceae bacterium]HCA89958.1 LicD family protein [Legionellales bacterium]|tara:strand:+ start:412 stop:1227 length:816 start_codon:yes stop_codon:yes gene_type:complete
MNQLIITDGRLRQAQLKMLAMLKVIDGICLKHQLDYWLDAGSLLGAVRHQGFIPWDDDLDIAMPRDSYIKFLDIAPAELPETMQLQQAGFSDNYYNLGTPLKIRDKHSYYQERHEKGQEKYLQGIFIDVFVYDTMPTQYWRYILLKRFSRFILRLLATKYSSLPMGRKHIMYRTIGKGLSKQYLNHILDSLVRRAVRYPQTYLGRGHHCKKKSFLQYAHIYPLQRIQFEDGFFNAPFAIDPILRQQYGNYHELPPEHERTLRHCVELIPEC